MLPPRILPASNVVRSPPPNHHAIIRQIDPQKTMMRLESELRCITASEDAMEQSRWTAVASAAITVPEESVKA